MILSTKDVLKDKKGIAEALGITMVVLLILSVAGVVVANYAVHSKIAAQLSTISQEITNRAESYAAALNADLLAPQVPSMSRECSSTPALCTTILSATPSADGKATVLRIQGDTVAVLGQSLTKDLTLTSSEVTHVTNLDPDGNKVWALSEEGLRYTTWSVAAGEASTVKPGDMTGPKTSTPWVSVDDRAGIDSQGALWVWGKNDIGQAGVGSASAQPVKPTKVSTDTTSFRTVVTGDDRGYAIDSKGAIWAWGKNDRGQLGIAGSTTNITTPTKIAGHRVMSVSIGKDSAFGITMSGDLITAGTPQPGLTINPGTGFQQANAGTIYKAVSASTAGALATIDQAGKLSVTGSSYTFTPRSGDVFTSVSLGETAGYAMGTNGRVYSFGQGPNGELGLGATTSANQATLVNSPNLVSVQATKTGALFVDVTGSLHYVGKLPGGVSSTSLPPTFVLAKLLPDTTFRAVATNSGDNTAALLDTQGNLYGLGTVTAGLWPITYAGPANQPIRMPIPDGFPTFTWK